MASELKKVMIVEDDKPMAMALKLKLESSGFDVVVASDGEDGLKMIEEVNLSLILLDLVMPRMDGFKFLEELKKRGSKIPVMVLTNLGEDEDEARAKELGAEKFFTKSKTTIKSIVEEVEDFLD